MEQVATPTDERPGGEWSPPAAPPPPPSALLTGPLAPTGAIAAALSPATDPADAERRTRVLAHAHYENFSVVSLLLPRHLRQDFCNVYAFCRVADDLGDELGDPRASTAALASLRERLLACHAGEADTVLFVALRETLRRHAIPPGPFLDLIGAFEQDQHVTRYDTFEQLSDYCRRSANPVGRLVLYLAGYRDAERQRLSDATCTALQLANFWQDVRRDFIDRERIYLPSDDMRRFGVSEADLRAGIDAGRCGAAFAALVEFQVARTAALFDEGDALLPLLDPAVRGQVALYGKGGRLVLDAIRAQGYDTLARRPALGRWQKGRLVLSVLTSRLMTRPRRLLLGRGCRA
jgi:squalene synthase HpnC